jgi:hypothetical protein
MLRSMRTGFLLSLFMASFVAGCGNSDVPLKEVRDDAFGYVIRVPEAATQTEHEKTRHVWSWTFNNQVDSYHCIIEPESGLDPFTPDAARKQVEMVRKPGDIKSVEAQGNDGVLVELAEDPIVHYRESWFFRRGKTMTLAAICSGPAKGSTVTKMATSLRVTL